MAVALLSALGIAGCGGGSFNPSSNVTATPTFSPGGGAYSAPKAVTISDQTSGAVFYCTTDGTTPTTSSPKCSQPTTVFQTEFLQAIAVAPGKNPSTVASAAYTITLSAAATPTFSPAGGSYTSPQQVTLSDATTGANIYYTVDGSVPTAASALYTGPVAVSSSQTINAIAAASGYSTSGVASAAYTINQPVAAPVFSLATGNYASAQMVTISDATPNAAIYYAINSSAPSSSSIPYAGPITVSKTETISAIAVVNGSVSPITVVAYTISAVVAVPAPTFNPAAGTISAGQQVTIADADQNAAIYYTSDGSIPDATSTQYTAPITLSTQGTTAISAIAIDSGESSQVASATYTVLPPSTPGTPFNGTVLSGTKPVKNSTVQLYAAGLSGYSTNATTLGSPVTTDSNGAFSMSTYNCPPSPGDLIYLVVTGGDTGAGPNSALDLMTALGPCSQLTSTSNIVTKGIIVNEVTTVASSYALAQFMTTAPNVSSSSGNYQGMSNAFGTVNNLVDVTTGNSLSITPAYASNPVPYLNSSTVPQARINTLAGILNACVDSNGASSTGCSGLFGNATPASGTAPDNTLQAILDIAQNPGANVPALFDLASSSGPFQPLLIDAPNDWTLTLTFTGAGLGIAPGTSATVQVGGNTYTGVGPIINTSLAIDANGNIWVTAYGENTPFSPAVGGAINSLLAGFNNLGAPLTPATTLSSDNPPVVTFGGFVPEPNALLALTVGAFDQTGNLWLGDGSASGNILKVSTTPNLSVVLPPQALGNSVFSAAIDGNGNAWFGNLGGIYALQNDGTKILSSNGQSSTNTSTYDSLAYLAFDANGGLWGADFLVPTLYQINTSDGSIASNLFPSGASFTPLTLAADGSGNVYVCGDSGGQTLDVFNAGGAAGNYPISTSRGCGAQLLLDGQGHFFAVSDGLGYPPGAAVDEFTVSGNAVSLSSPANGYTGTSDSELPTITQDPNIPLGISYYPQNAAIDSSGNLWVLNADTNGSPQPGNVLVEFVGLAAPVVTPTSIALQHGQLGARP